MAAKLWTKDSAMTCIARNGGKVSEPSITMKSAGIKVLGAIDYLKEHHNFIWIHEESKKAKREED